MSRYDNIPCPVCNRFFVDGDDVVVCPDCGTPHHRECYNYVGHCVNRGLHKTGFIFETDLTAVPEAEFKAQKPIQNESEEFNAASPVMPFSAVPEFTQAYDADNETIDGESIGDVAATVKNNIPRFISVFKKLEKGEKKLSWNWGAFFFGSLYFFYRKLYRHAVSLISAFMLLLFGFDFAIVKLAPKCAEIITQMSNVKSNSMNSLMETSNELAEKLLASPDYSVYKGIVIGFFVSVLVLRIIEALLADKMYKKAVSQLIKKVRIQLDEGASFSTPMADVSQMNLSQEQMKRFYLAGKGGVSFFAPVMAVLAVEMLLTFI